MGQSKEGHEVKTWSIYLRPKSSVSTWLTSDTLFGAICWAIRRLYDANTLTDWIKRCQVKEPGWVLSSAFPFVGNKEPLHFLPKPLTLNPDANIISSIAGNDRKRLLEAMQAAKTLSKVIYLSENLFKQAINGALTAKALLEQFLGDKLVQKGVCLMTKEETSKLPENFWDKIDVQHTAVDRVLTSAAEGLLYFDAEYFFGKGTGLFFLIRCPDNFPLEAILRLWRYDGLGGNRSVGKGHFEPDFKPADDWLTNLQPSNGNAVVLLSRCLPQQNEFDGTESVYRFISHRPKFESAYGQSAQVYKGIVRMIGEGSVLVPTKLKLAYGRLLKVGKQQDWDGNIHLVFQNGLGFPIRMVMPNEVE